MIIVLQVHLNNSIDQLWDELQSLGFAPLYSVEELDQSGKLYVNVPPELESLWVEVAHRFPKYCVEPLADIDWNAQWEAHAQGFDGGFAHINLQEFGFEEEIKLIPGPGFGDLSHPTTRLVLKLMSNHVANCHVVDIGCGSGILALSALKMGARSACGIDIDLDAIEHSRQNAIHNQLQTAHFTEPTCFHTDPSFHVIALMNMICSEQCVAYETFVSNQGYAHQWLTSGVLVTEQQEYLKECMCRGWKLVEQVQEGEWAAFRFTQV